MTPTTEYAIGFSAGSVACMYIYRQVLATVRERKNGNGKNGNSGSRPVEFWEGKFNSLDTHAQRQTAILEKQTEVLQDQSRLLTELVTIARLQSKN